MYVVDQVGLHNPELKIQVIQTRVYRAGTHGVHILGTIFARAAEGPGASRGRFRPPVGVKGKSPGGIRNFNLF